MCGLVGYSGAKDANLIPDKIKLLLFYNQDRGKDSLGYYSPKSGIYKEIGKPEDQMIKANFELPESPLFIGHVRAATVGDVNKDNAHPFIYGNIVLAMNGTLNNHWGLVRDYDLSANEFSVDTQVLAAIINQTQSAEVLKKISGGCAILYTETGTNKLYAFTNGQRPLFRGTFNGSMYISSIENSLKLIGCTSVKTFKDNYLYEIEDGKIINHILLTPVTSTNVLGGSILYDTVGKYAYVGLTLYNLKDEELHKMWLTPDRKCDQYNLREGFAYKCVPSPTKLSVGEVAVINELGEIVTVPKTTFLYKSPVISVGSFAFAVSMLSYIDDTKESDNKVVFCQEGDLLYVKERASENSYLCRNIRTQDTANIPIKFIRHAWRVEVDEYMAKKSKLTAKNQLKLELSSPKSEYPVLQPIETEQMAELKAFWKELESTDLADEFVDHVDFCIDNIEDLVADLDENQHLDSNARKQIECIKIVLEYYIKHLGNYFELNEDGFVEYEDVPNDEVENDTVLN